VPHRVVQHGSAPSVLYVGAHCFPPAALTEHLPAARAESSRPGPRASGSRAQPRAATVLRQGGSRISRARRTAASQNRMSSDTLGPGRSGRDSRALSRRSRDGAFGQVAVERRAADALRRAAATGAPASTSSAAARRSTMDVRGRPGPCLAGGPAPDSGGRFDEALALEAAHLRRHRRQPGQCDIFDVFTRVKRTRLEARSGVDFLLRFLFRILLPGLNRVRTGNAGWPMHVQ